ncbi:MAG: hypothetical protein FWB83_04450 [Treponema sp.]|nr:hypothetical protein [Treponema sp.]
MRHIYISDVDGKQAVCFETAMDTRSFARTGMSQSLIEKGYIVFPDGSHEVWKPAGVKEINGSMRVWGPLFKCERLDQIIIEVDLTSNVQAALQAVLLWIRAKMFLGDTQSTLNPGAAFILREEGVQSNYKKGCVFFAPEHLSRRCLHAEGMVKDNYYCPDLIGMNAAAFCAGVMLYKILTKAHPFTSLNYYQDMREGVFLPVRLAAPELNEKLSALIQNALVLPADDRTAEKSGTDILTELLALLTAKDNNAVNVSSLFTPLTAEKAKRVEKEKKNYYFKQNVTIKTRRFISRNKIAILGSAAALIVFLFILFTMTNNFSHRPTTEGMPPDTVVHAYYDAFSSLNYEFMEACIQRADRSDINAAVSLTAITRTRQAYDLSTEPYMIPARVWLENGGELPAPNVFGVTNLNLTNIGGSEDQGLVVFRAEYLLWAPIEEYQYSKQRIDVITLSTDRRNHWRIIEILRSES